MFGVRFLFALIIGAFPVVGSTNSVPAIAIGTSVGQLVVEYGRPELKGCTPMLGDKLEMYLYPAFMVLVDNGKTIDQPRQNARDYDVKAIKSRKVIAGVVNPLSQQMMQLDVMCF